MIIHIRLVIQFHRGSAQHVRVVSRLRLLRFALLSARGGLFFRVDELVRHLEVSGKLVRAT